MSLFGPFRDLPHHKPFKPTHKLKKAGGGYYYVMLSDDQLFLEESWNKKSEYCEWVVMQWKGRTPYMAWNGDPWSEPAKVYPLSIVDRLRNFG